TFSTSICLFSCFVSCSILFSSGTSTTKVIFEIPSISDVPTVMLSILNALLDSIPVILFRTPLEFCTVAVIIRCIFSLLAFHDFLCPAQPSGILYQVSALWHPPAPARHRRRLPSSVPGLPLRSKP